MLISTFLNTLKACMRIPDSCRRPLGKLPPLAPLVVSSASEFDTGGVTGNPRRGTARWRTRRLNASKGSRACRGSVRDAADMVSFWYQVYKLAGSPGGCPWSVLAITVFKIRGGRACCQCECANESRDIVAFQVCG